MEYRTTHQKVIARLERKKLDKERKKTKGKFIVSQSCIKLSETRYTQMTSPPSSSPSLSSPSPLSQTKLKDMATGRSKDKEGKKVKGAPVAKNSYGIPGIPAGEEVDAAEMELVAILANQVVREEKKKIKAGIKKMKKGKQTKMKISEYIDVLKILFQFSKCQ